MDSLTMYQIPLLLICIFLGSYITKHNCSLVVEKFNGINWFKKMNKSKGLKLDILYNILKKKLKNSQIVLKFHTFII